MRVGKFLGKHAVSPVVKHSECHSCKLLPLCGQCPGWVQMEHGEDDGPVDFLCEVAHLRANALGVLVD